MLFSRKSVLVLSSLIVVIAKTTEDVGLTRRTVSGLEIKSNPDSVSLRGWRTIVNKGFLVNLNVIEGP